MQEIVLNLLESYSAAAFFGAFAAGALTAMAPCSLISAPLTVASAAAGAKELEGCRKAVFNYHFTTLAASAAELPATPYAQAKAEMGKGSPVMLEVGSTHCNACVEMIKKAPSSELKYE